MAEFAHWYFSAMPRLLFRIGRGYTRQIYFSLSVPILLKTLFAPWRRDTQSMENLSLTDRFGVMIQNLVSRIIGAVVRLMAFGLACFAIICTFLVSLSAEVVWVTMPFLIIFFFGTGLKLLMVGR